MPVISHPKLTSLFDSYSKDSSGVINDKKINIKSPTNKTERSGKTFITYIDERKQIVMTDVSHVRDSTFGSTIPSTKIVYKDDDDDDNDPNNENTDNTDSKIDDINDNIIVYSDDVKNDTNTNITSNLDVDHPKEHALSLGIDIDGNKLFANNGNINGLEYDETNDIFVIDTETQPINDDNNNRII